MKFYYLLLTAITGVTAALVQPQVAVALSSQEVNKIAAQITVRVESRNSPGSGVIIKREGNTYTVVTCKHVVAKTDKYTIVTPDGVSYPVEYSKVKPLKSGLDLAVVTFTSNKNYTVAKIGDSNTATVGTEAYVAGFPAPTAVVSRSLWRFTRGEITANATQPLDQGYALVYSNSTIQGMSGGPVLNQNGELIGIHGRAETTVDDNSQLIRTGFNLGIPINTFLTVASSAGVDLRIRPFSPRPSNAPTADDFFIQAGDKVKKRDFQGAIADYNQVIQLDSNNAEAYRNRGNVRFKMGDNKGAMEDYNQAINLNSNDARAYNNRGNVLARMGDEQGAIEDYNQALRIDSNFVIALRNRANIYAQLRDYQSEIEDLNQLIRLNPKDPEPYYRRVFAYNLLEDKQGEVEALNQLIRFNPNDAYAYYIRGMQRFIAKDEQGALADFQQTADLAQRQGNTSLYQEVQDKIEDIKRIYSKPDKPDIYFPPFEF